MQGKPTMTGYLLLMNGEASFARNGWLVMIRAILQSELDYESRRDQRLPAGFEVENSRI